MARIKAPSYHTRAEFETAIDEAAHLTTEIRKLEAARDAKVQAAQRGYGEAISPLLERLNARVAAAEKYADEHRAELLPSKAKSAETPLARYGFRTGNPTLKTLAKWTWEKVVQALDDRGIDDKYVRVRREADKAAMLAALNARGILGTSTEPALVGVRVVQEETFYIDPKVDGAEAVSSAE